VLFFTATTTPPQSKTCPLLCIDMCFSSQLVILNCLRQITLQLLKVCLFLAAGTTRLSNTRQATISQHVLCLAAIVPPQSNRNHIAASECVLLSCSWYDQTVQDMPVVMSQHVLFVAAGTTRLSKTCQLLRLNMFFLLQLVRPDCPRHDSCYVSTCSLSCSWYDQTVQDKKLALLNAKPENVRREAQIIAQAGLPGAVTIATNMAGRGTDIVLGGNPKGLALQVLMKLFAHYFISGQWYNPSSLFFGLISASQVSGRTHILFVLAPFLHLRSGGGHLFCLAVTSAHVCTKLTALCEPQA